jgi:hypothetical protein
MAYFRSAGLVFVEQSFGVFDADPYPGAGISP